MFQPFSIHAEWREADGAVTQSIEHEFGEIIAAAHFRDPEGVIGAIVDVEDFLKETGVAGVDVRSDDVDGGSEGAPEADEFLHGAAAGILDAGDGDAAFGKFGRRIAEPDVHIERNGEFGFAGGGDFVEIVGLIIGLKGFIGFGTEDLTPGAGLLFYDFEEIGGNLLREAGVGFGRKIADGADVAGFVFDLQQEDGVFGGVDGFQVAHESGESGFIGFEIGVGVGGEDVEGFAAGIEHARVSFWIGLDPLGGVVHVAVFPGAEPEEDQVEMVFAGAGDERVDIGEIEFALLGFELFPVNGGFESVGVEKGHALPDLREFGGPGAGVVNLAAEDEIGLAIDEEGPAAVFLDELGSVGSVGGIAGEGGGEEKKENSETMHGITSGEI